MNIRVSTSRHSPGSPPPWSDLEAFAELSRRSSVAIFGDDDLHDTTAALGTAFVEQNQRRKAMLLARDGARAVGGIWVRMPLMDNTSIALASFCLDPEHDPAEIVGALWAEMLLLMRAEGRRTVHLFSSHRLAPDGEHRIPRTGVGRLPVDALTTTLEGLGLVLEQVERHTILEVAPALEVAAVEGPRARAVAGTAYRTLSWVGRTPAEHLEGLAVLLARMSTDPPIGELQIEPEQWDAERVADTERVGEAMGRQLLTTVAQHVESGELVAYTQFDRPLDTPVIAYQEGTLVVPEHRGHRLGMLVKTVNLELLAQHAPSVRRVHTSNAGENEHMLAINVALGFRERAAEGSWQLTGI